MSPLGHLLGHKKWQISVALIILNFDPKICTKVCNSAEHFFWLSGFQLMTDQVILNFDGWWIKCVFTP